MATGYFGPDEDFCNYKTHNQGPPNTFELLYASPDSLPLSGRALGTPPSHRKEAPCVNRPSFGQWFSIRMPTNRLHFNYQYLAHVSSRIATQSISSISKEHLVEVQQFFFSCTEIRCMSEPRKNCVRSYMCPSISTFITHFLWAAVPQSPPLEGNRDAPSKWDEEQNRNLSHP